MTKTDKVHDYIEENQPVPIETLRDEFGIIEADKGVAELADRGILNISAGWEVSIRDG